MSELLKVRITLTGTRPLIMHNPQGIDPRNLLKKEVKELLPQAKKQDTDEAWMSLWKVEHVLSMYHDPAIGPYLPGVNVYASILAGARHFRKGPKIEGGLLLMEDKIPLIYQGPRTLEGLWADQNFADIRNVGIGQKQIMCCRPIFHSWHLEVDAQIVTSALELDEFKTYLTMAGLAKGLGDARKLGYGKYSTLVEEV